MANDMKSGIGFLIPGAGVVGFFASLLMGEFLISIIIAVSGILVWFLYMLVMEAHMPEEMGNMIILFGILLALGIFFGFGVKENMWGGFEFQTEGSIFSLIILFFSVLTGLNFRNQQTSGLASGHSAGGLSDQDRELVMSAIDKAQATAPSSSSEQPKVIVVKQETGATDSSDAESKEEGTKNQNPHNPYDMMNNPYFAYPPDYYYDDEDDEDDDDEWEYEDEWDEEED